MVGRFVQEQNVRLGKKEADQGDLCLFAPGKIRQPLVFVFFGKPEPCEQPVVFLFIGKTLRVKGIFARAGFQKFFLHSPAGSGKCLLVQHPHGHFPGRGDPGAVALVIPVQG